MTVFSRTSSGNTDFRQLVTLLDAHLAVRDGDDHTFYAQYNTIEDLHHVIVCYIDDKPIACGAFKEYDKEKAEIKRMFVLPGYRGKGIGIKLLKELELWAAEHHFSKCILETGRNNPEAVSLYQKAGYQIIENYGQYKDIDTSVCMSKPVRFTTSFRIKE